MKKILSLVSFFCFLFSYSLQAEKPVESPVYPLFTTFLLGGWHGGDWKNSDDIAGHVDRGTSWWLYSLKGKTGRINGRKPTYRQELGGYYDIEFYEADNEEYVQDGEIAVGNLDVCMPRKPVLQKGGLEPYKAEIRKMLENKGLNPGNVDVSEVVRCDLDGNGSDEVIIVAQNADAKVPVFRRGTYSIVLFRHLVKGKVETVVLKEHFYMKNISGEANSPENYSVPFIIDANADGKMEVILKGRYYEGVWYEVYEYKDNALKKVLEAGVGA